MMVTFICSGRTGQVGVADNYEWRNQECIHGRPESPRTYESTPQDVSKNRVLLEGEAICCIVSQYTLEQNKPK